MKSTCERAETGANGSQTKTQKVSVPTAKFAGLNPIYLYMKTILLILLFSVNAKAVDLGSFNVTYDFCKQVNKIGSILNAFQLTQWPVTGMPGIVQGLSMRTNPIVDMCSYIAQIKSADTADALFLTGEKLNELTKSGFKAELDFSRSAWNLANSQYDFNRGKQRAASLDAVYTAGKIGNFMKSVGRYQKTKKKQEDEFNDQEKIQELAKLSRERAIIQEQMQCPKPKSNKDYSQVYESEFQPALQKKDYYQKDVEFIVAMLSNMGPRFLRGRHLTEEQLKNSGRKNISAEEKWGTYEAKLRKLVAAGVRYKQSTKFEMAPSTEKTTEKDADGAFKTKKTNVKKESQEFSVEVDSGLFSEFSGLYGTEWRQWAQDYWAEGLKEWNGLDKLKREFAEIAQDCNPARLAGQYHDEQDIKAKARLDQMLTKCKDEKYKELDRSRVLGLFDYYVKELLNSLTLMKRSQAKVWTLDSYHLGRHRVISVNMKDQVAEEQVTCAENLSMADMQLLNLKAQNVNTKLNQQIAEDAMKQTVILEEQEAREQEAKEEQKRRNELVEREVDDRNKKMRQMPRSLQY